MDKQEKINRRMDLFRRKFPDEFLLWIRENVEIEDTEIEWKIEE